MRILTLVVLLALAGCGTLNKPKACTGPIFKLNEEHWDGLPLATAAPATEARPYHV